ARHAGRAADAGWNIRAPLSAKSTRRLPIAGDRAAGGSHYLGSARERGAIAGLKNLPYSAGVGVGVAEVGIEMVWPACNLRPSSMWLAFCNSSMVTLYILAMDVSVSPRATMCVLPAAAECDGTMTGAAGFAGGGVLSPIMIPGRKWEISCSSFRIS